MSIFFNFDKNFEKQALILVNSNIKICKTIDTNDGIFFVDEQSNVHSFNSLKANNFKKTLEKTKNYSMTHLDLADEEKFKKIVKKHKLNIKLEEKTYFTIGKIIKRYSHPKSDKLFLLDIDINEEKPITIVTNTLESTENKIVVIARLGAMMPSGLEIKPNKIMDFESKAMLCSYKTLGLSKEKEGIIILESKFENKIGQEFDF
ncbi:TyrS-associated PheT N-terminal domain-related protein TapR [Mycoplasmopsis hyopharyngis]|uniref:TyrS-associated PheT N-terminal domain-related protein TapR n=1 Tax=Mycoplasmopsis hyopharyngis TaxID=29558 RepID=UPI00387351C2